MRTLPVCLGLVVFSSACGGGTAVPVGNSSTATDFCRSIAPAVAGMAVRCYGGTLSTWEGIYANVVDCSHVAASIASDRTAYDAAKGAACLAEIANVDCSNTNEISPCTTALVGRVPTGEACPTTLSLFSECAPGAFCKTAVNVCGGTCQAYAPAGASCVSSTTSTVRCDPDTSCQSTMRICVADSGEGQPCEGPNAGGCVSGLFCDGATSAVAGTCRKRKTSGTCLLGGDCATGYACVGTGTNKACTKMKLTGEACTPGNRECFTLFHCASNGRCEDQAASGQPCGSDENKEYVACASGLYCANATTTTMGSCSSPKSAGSPCSGSNYSECAGIGSYCDSQTKRCVACN